MRKVVIVDDDRWAIRDICDSFAFEKYGFEVIAQCASAEEALPIILSRRPELIITDVCMDGMDGLDLLKSCRSKMVESFFVVISGYDLFEYAQEAINEGANYFLLKPIDTNEVQRLMTRIAIRFDQLPKKTANNAFSEIVQYVKEHYAENLTLSSVSERFYMDRSYLSRMFSRNLDMTFTEFKQRLQISRAMELLNEGYNIGEIAEAVGFNDVRYFFRVFKKIAGTTPYQYKKRE